MIASAGSLRRHLFRVVAAAVLAVALLVSLRPSAEAATVPTHIARVPESPTHLDTVRVWMHSNTSFGESAALEYEVGGSYIKVLGTWDDTTVPGANFWADIPAQPNGATVQYQLFTRNTSGGNEGNFTGFNWSYTVNDGDIQWDGLYHDTFNGYYRDPFGAVPADTDVTLRFRTTPLDVDGVAVRVYTYDPSTNPPSTSGAVDYPMTYLEDQGGYAIWTVTLDTPDTPAILYYHFVITDGLDVDYYSDDHGGPHDNVNQGGTGAASDNQGAEGFQLTVYDPAFQTPDWLQNAVVYQIFPDRFRNGDPSNDYCRGGGTTGCPLFYGDQDILLREPWNSLIGDPRQPGPYQNEYGTQFYGGDLQGLIDKLDYLKAAGFDTIYTTPIFDGSSNHRYDTDDYLAIDPALGTQADFDALIAALDARGMHLIVDGVFNHTSSDSVYFDRYHRYSGNDGACESLGSTYRDWYNFYNNDAPCGTGDYEGWFGYDSLAVLQDGSAEVRDFIYRDANSVVDTWYDRGVAGWRFDVADEISHNWWRDFRPYAKADAPNGPLVGEVWPDASNFLLGDQLDSVMNYRFRKNVLGFVRQAGFADNDNNGNNEIISLTPSQFDRALMSVREDYPAEATAAMLNLLDSHDTNRLRYLVDILGESDAQTLQRQKLAAVFQYTYMGAPMVYYGDEVALDSPSLANGVNGPEDDPYNRAPYPWADEAGDADAYGPADADMLAFYSRLAELRGDYDALRGEEFHTLLTGDTTGDSQDNTTYAYARPGSPAAIVALNPGSSANTASIPVDAYYGEGETLEDMLSGDTYVVTGGAVEVALPARSGVLLLPATTTITIEKVVVGDASGVSQWEFTDPYGNPFSLPAAGGSTLLSVFPSAPLSVSETVPNDWSATAACDTGATGTDSVEVTLDVGQDVTCTFTNTQDAPPSGDLTITKVVAGTPPGADWAFSGDLGPFNLPASGGGATYSDQAVGGYTINETYVPGWATTTSCSPGGETGDRSVSLTLDDGEAAECVFTNTLCQPGTYDDMAACVSTDAGYYTDTPGAVAQLACVPGYYQPAGGQTSCLAANPGYYVATSAAISQTECSPGKYQSNYAAVQCNLADPGYYAAGTAAPTQTACSPGSYQPNSGQESCLLADAGYYVDAPAATAQTACPAGTTSPPASDSVDDCVSTTADLTIVKATDPAGGAGFPFTLDPGAVTFADKWGSNGVGQGDFNGPFGIAVDAAGNVYVADTFAYRVQKFDAGGNFILMWGRDVQVGGVTSFEICLASESCKAGTNGSGNGEFNLPHGIAVDGNGNVYVSDSSNDRIQKFDADGNYAGQWGGLGDEGGQFDNPTGVAVDDAGNVYVADSFNNRVQKFDAAGNFLLAWGYNVIDGGGINFEICTPADTCQAGSSATGNGAFDDPFGVAVYGTTVYVADTFNHRVQVFDTNGNYLDQWGSEGNGNSQFDRPYGLAADAAGNIYVADSNNARMQKFDGDGDTLGQWGVSGLGDGQFYYNTGVAVSGAGVYVSDYNFHRVQRFSQTGATLDDGQSHTFAGLAPGAYLVSELVPAGWVLDDIDCGAATVTESGNTVSVTLAAGDAVTCTFSNVEADTAAPETTIDTGPTGTVSSPDATFTFSSEAGATFQCRLDGGAWEQCDDGDAAYTGLSDGSHTFEVYACDAAGNCDATPATRTWTIDTTAPTVTINQASGQADPTSASPIAFTVVFSEPVIGFATGDVTLSGTAGATTATVTPVTATTYNVAVSGMTGSGTVIATVAAAVADDAAGNDNTASTSTDNTVTYDVNAPDTTILSFPFNPSSSSSATFTFSGTDSGGSGVASFECRLDGGSWTACTSPQNYSGLSDGSHTFEVRAIDAAGNTDPTPASYTWLIDTTSPSVTINQASGQADPTGSSPINFTVVFSEPVSGFATGDVTLSGTAGATTAAVTGGPTTYNVAVSGMTNSGTVIATVAANVAQDAAGNGNAASTSTDNQVTYNAPAPAGAIYVTAAGGNAPGAGAYQKNDILKWNGSVWSVWFDGATRGLPATADIMAFDVDNDAARSAWIVIRQVQKLPGVGKMEPTQIAYYNGTTWSRFFDGRDVGLLTTGERINGLEVLPGSVSPIGSGCLYYLLISTVAGGGVPVGNSNVNFTGEDVLGFCMTSMGTNTAGTWHIRFEGQAEGLQKNNNLGLSASANGATLYFTVKQNFTGDGGLIRPSQLFSFSGGVFSGPLWKAADHGLTQQVDGIDVVGSIP